MATYPEVGAIPPAMSSTHVAQTLQHQDNIIREQDNALGTISNQLGVLRNMGRQINGELVDQARASHSPLAAVPRPLHTTRRCPPTLTQNEKGRPRPGLSR